MAFELLSFFVILRMLRYTWVIKILTLDFLIYFMYNDEI